MQTDKVRPIDDFSESFVNSTVRSKEKVDLVNVDDIAAVCKMWHKILDGDGDIRVALSTGRILKGSRDPAHSTGEPLVGKCFDLEAAYKQFPIAEADRGVSVIAVTDEKAPGGIAYFLARALPFGASGSVFGFNRAARAFQKCIVGLLGLPILNYFDDYPIILPKGVAAVADDAIKQLADLLGWSLKGGEKDLDFAEEFKVLGVAMNVGSVISERRLTVRNTDTRKKNLAQQFAEILEEGRLGPALASQLVGRIGFASSQLFARSGSAALWHLRRRAHQRGMATHLSPQLAAALRCWGRSILTAPPRSIVFGIEDPPLLVFTDGHCDQEKVTAGIGAVIFDPITGTKEAFGAAIPEPFLNVLREEGHTNQVIAQAEILPVIFARVKWNHLMTAAGGRRVLWFVDNDAARYGLIKGYSPTRASAWLLSEAWRHDEKSGAVSWFERVPSKSNCADGPSRLDFSRLGGLFGGGTREVSSPDIWDELLRHRIEVGA